MVLASRRALALGVVVSLLLAQPEPGLTQQAAVDPAPLAARAWIDTARTWRAATSAPDDSGIGLRGAATAEPGPLPLTVVIEDLNAPGTGAWLQDTVNVPAIGGLPQLSDIAGAQAEGGSWTRDGRTFLQVTPAHVTNPDGSIYTYFEAYGVRPGTPYEVELRLTEADAAGRIWRLEPDDLAFRLQFTSEMPGDIGRHHLRLDLSDTEPGEYVLAVRIQTRRRRRIACRR